MAATRSVDLAILGGGLAGGLIALALVRMRPELSILLVEGDNRLGGNHVWSFFDSDIAPAHRWLTGPLISHAWPGHDVRFADHARSFATGYNSIESERFDTVVRTALPDDALLTGIAVTDVTPNLVMLANGDCIAADGVIDARGAGDLSALRLGYQKCLGQLLELDRPHGLVRPVIMDASVDQTDGYRFVYVLPFGPRALFVEDTYYTDGPDLDPAGLSARIASYAVDHGWQVQRVARTETGVLPVCMGGDFDRFWLAGGVGIAKAGLRGGFFHAMTGYSLVDAVRVAAMVAALPDLSAPAMHAAFYKAAARHWHGGAFYRLLATMLFRAADPPDRHRILSRFYRLDPSLIDSFYAGRSTLAHKLRILAGKPPVPIGRAIRAIGANEP